MNKFEFLSNLRGVWAIDSRIVDDYWGAVSNFLNGNFEFSKEEEPLKNKPFAISAISDRENNSYSSYDEAPKGSIAIIPIFGVMTKQEQFCGPAGTLGIAYRIKQASEHENIDGIILQYDSGGGAVNSIYPLIEAIKNVKKPIISFVDDLMASAALVTGAYAGTIIASHDMAEIGSLGVMAAFSDKRPVSEKEGVIFHTVYADQSTMKNISIESAFKGDYQALKDKELNPLAENFIKDMKRLRGNKITNNSVYAADMFFAKDAKKIGLIDDIGNLDFAVQKLTKIIRANKNLISTNNKKNMNKKQIPALLMVLGLASIEQMDNKFSLNAEQVSALHNHFSETFGKNLLLKGASINEDGSADFSESALLTLNALITEETANKLEVVKASKNTVAEDLKKEYDTKIIALNAKIDKLSSQPEDVIIPIADGKKVLITGFKKNATGINAATPDRPWNTAALAIAEGRKKEASFITASGITEAAIDQFIEDYKLATTNVDISQMNNVLGAYHREVSPEILDMMVANEEVTSIFPYKSTGIKDEWAQIAEYVSEHLQPRNGGDWVEKGSNEFQADVVKLDNWQVTRTFTKDQMFQLIESWLGTKTVGTDPYQEPFLMWFIDSIKKQIANVERPKNVIKGVFVTPVDGVAGRSINSQDGAIKALQRKVDEFRILPMKVGKGSYNILDGSGNINKDHVYQKIVDMIMFMPQSLREAYNWRVLMSKDDYRERMKFLKEIIASDSNYADRESANSFDNFTYVPVPHFPNGLYVITLVGNGLQLYREKNDDNRMYVEKLKRNTHVHMDGAAGFVYPWTGKKFATLAELKTAKYEFQRIFTNAEFGAYTTELMTANDTTPSVANHNVLETVANTGATVITTIDNSYVGQKIFIVGGSSTNPASIAAANTNFIGLLTDITFNPGVTAEFEVTATGKFTLVALYDANNQAAVVFAADDATPNVAGAYTFMTSNENTTGNEDITDLENAQAGKTIKIIGGGGTYPSTITKAGKFQLISATWTGDIGEEIILQKRPDGLFVEVTV